VIHSLTKTDQELRVDLMRFDGEKAYALFSTFKVGNESSKYRLTVSGYSGTAGMCVSRIILASLIIECFRLNIKYHTIYMSISVTVSCTPKYPKSQSDQFFVKYETKVIIQSIFCKIRN
jgi:hypothetical protein